MIDLEAVRKRWRESYDEGGALYWLRGEYPATTDDLMVDIDALIAEVERLQHEVTHPNGCFEHSVAVNLDVERTHETDKP